VRPSLFRAEAAQILTDGMTGEQTPVLRDSPPVRILLA
jgi:hypothetical protein